MTKLKEIASQLGYLNESKTLSDIRSWMEELPEDTTVYVPDLYPSKLGELTPKVHKIFPPGATNIGYTLQGWLEEFEKRYPDAQFNIDGENIEVIPGSSTKYDTDLEADKKNRVDNTPPPGSWRKRDNMGNLTDPWS